jgi:hypothetical protein
LRKPVDQEDVRLGVFDPVDQKNMVIICHT